MNSSRISISHFSKVSTKKFDFSLKTVFIVQPACFCAYLQDLETFMNGYRVLFSPLPTPLRMISTPAVLGYILLIPTHPLSYIIILIIPPQCWHLILNWSCLSVQILFLLLQMFLISLLSQFCGFIAHSVFLFWALYQHDFAWHASVKGASLKSATVTRTFFKMKIEP